MKCIKNDQSGQVVRISDKEAAKAVMKSSRWKEALKEGSPTLQVKGWHYTSKSQWKAAGRPK